MVSDLRPRWLPIALSGLLLVGAIAADGSEPSSPPASVVQVGGCSGVCVDESGLILTARHCDLKEVERVRFADYEVVAVRVYESDETEGPVVYDCVGAGYPWTQVSAAKPEIGEAVRTMGYPDIAGERRLRQVEGEVQRGGLYRFRGGDFQGNLTNLPLHEGWSGGPLLNHAGEVVGLATSTDGIDSIFISHAATRQAYAAAVRLHRKQPPLEIEIDAYSTECLRFLADYASDQYLRSELQEHFRISLVDARRSADTEAEAASQQLPVFRIAGTAAARGYSGKINLLTQLIPRRPRPSLEPSEPTESGDTSKSGR